MKIGIVLLAEQEVGIFNINDDESVTFQFYRGAAGIEETLDYATERGLTFSLMYKPDYDGKTQELSA